MRGQGREAVTFDTGEFNVFPSVSRGSVTIEKAKRVLEWEPSTWETVFKVRIGCAIDLVQRRVVKSCF